MKVAIMGAGLSGLACALTLEKNGITPTVFEKRSELGDRFVNGELLLSVLSHPIRDCLAYFAEDYGIFLQPLANIKQLTLYSENEQAVIKGNLGFINVRGRDSHSFEKQLGRQLKTSIVFNSKHSYEDLLREFTHVILATGDGAYTTKIQPFKHNFCVTLKGAIVEGDFDPYSPVAWLDNTLAPKGYCYLIPLSSKEANIVIAFPQYPETTAQHVNNLWTKFFKRVSSDLKQDLKIVSHFHITDYMIGICKTSRIGNTFFVGNCFGSIMPFLGFGQFSALQTGVFAANDLCGLGDYHQLTQPIRQSFDESMALRKLMEKLDNKKLDFMIKGLHSKLGDIVFNFEQVSLLKIVSSLLSKL